MTQNSPLPQQPSFVRQIFRFGVVGVLGLVADVGTFNLLRFAGGEGPLYDYPLSAKVISGANLQLSAHSAARATVAR